MIPVEQYRLAMKVSHLEYAMIVDQRFAIPT